MIEDIDKLDVNNELAVVEYIDDIYTFYKIAQVTNCLQQTYEVFCVIYYCQLVSESVCCVAA